MFKQMTQFINPERCYRLFNTIRPWAFWIAVSFLLCGLYGGLVLAPSDYQQGDAFRIIYVHVPCAFLSLGMYGLIAVMSVITLVWKVKVADCISASAAPIGAVITAIALVTGSIWGKPMWGTWWIWDARLTSELILLFIYFGLIALRGALPNHLQAMKACAILALIGIVDIPIIHFSVVWWHTLHQGSTVFRLQGPAIESSMLWPLMLMLLGMTSYTIWLLSHRVQQLLLRRERHSQWVAALFRRDQ